MSYEIETDEPIQFQCRHIFTDGRRCASPTLRSPGGHEPFCYYHHTTRGAAARTSQPSRESSAASNGRRSSFTLPLPEDRSSIQHSIGEVLRRIAANEIDSRRAGLLLYGLQIASLNLKKDRNTEDTASEETVTEITRDPTHGLLAPPAELHANEPISSAQRFLMELGEVDDDPPQAEPAASQPIQPQPPATQNLTVDLQACATSTNTVIPSVAPRPKARQIARAQVQTTPRSCDPSAAEPLEQNARANAGKPTTRVGFPQNNAGDHLISHTLARAVPSAQRGLTSVFEMGTGGTLAVNSPAN